MSRKIKTNILRPNNLTVLGSVNRGNAQEQVSLCSGQSSRYTLKSLSQERNIVKILRKIDSPGKLHISGQNLKSEVFETLFSIQQQVHALGQNRSSNRQQRRESIEKALRRGIPHSKISLTGKQNVSSINTPTETTRSLKDLNISKTILQKLKIIPLKGAAGGADSQKTFGTQSKQSLNTSMCKRRGIQLCPKIK